MPRQTSPRASSKVFAVVFGDDAGEAVVVLLQQPLEFEHHARAGGRRGVAPCGESALGAGDGAVDFGGRGARREGERFLGRRAQNGDFAPRAAGGKFAVDEQRDGRWHRDLL